MPRPGFYNDNEYRSYPFIYTSPPDAALPDNLIVDAGVIMGLDAEFDAAVHSVWLSRVSRNGAVLTVDFATDAPGALGTALQFTCNITDSAWQTTFAETAPAPAVLAACATEPVWEGFLTTSAAAYAGTMSANQTVTFAKNKHQLEPGRIQNLAKSYLRSISLGNYDRVRVPDCGAADTSDNRPIILNTKCMRGDIRLKEGYNCRITQTDRVNELEITAVAGAGAGDTGEELCEYHGDLRLFPGEQLPLGPVKPTKFIEAFDVHGQNPPSDTLLADLLPAGCAAKQIGDTYGWKSDLKTTYTVPPISFYSAQYYTWNNKAWIRSPVVTFNAIYEETVNGAGEIVIAPTGEYEDFPQYMPPDIQSIKAFLSGGPRCCELIATINGVGGQTVNIVGGAGVQIGTEPNKITVALDQNSQNNCAAGTTP